MWFMYVVTVTAFPGKPESSAPVFILHMECICGHVL